ncbi:hypothetical protein MVI01_15460 [Myxococcus virescens]|uniref:Uncharacterized protein n=1 Tax=Myxococcus virescens TaxID=83456 RepID=A0A511H899_9BACT|nr:hypothetical protein MVI01_15460 [Myxococcus virescens]
MEGDGEGAVEFGALEIAYMQRHGDGLSLCWHGGVEGPLKALLRVGPAELQNVPTAFDTNLIVRGSRNRGSCNEEAGDQCPSGFESGVPLPPKCLSSKMRCPAAFHLSLLPAGNVPG